MTNDNPVHRKIESARAARRQGRLEDAWAQFQALTELGRSSGSKETLVAGLRGLGQIENDRGNLSECLNFYAEATEVARELGDKLVLAHTIRHLGDIHSQVGNLDVAESYYVEALDLYRDEPQTSDLSLANAIRPFAMLMEKLSRRQEAKRLWKEAKILYGSASIDAGVAESEEALRRLS